MAGRSCRSDRQQPSRFDVEVAPGKIPSTIYYCVYAWGPEPWRLWLDGWTAWTGPVLPVLAVGQAGYLLTPRVGVMAEDLFRVLKMAWRVCHHDGVFFFFLFLLSHDCTLLHSPMYPAVLPHIGGRPGAMVRNRTGSDDDPESTGLSERKTVICTWIRALVPQRPV